ncbi:hypothetical protein [Fulvivirga sp.]|uniref:hypothetical protein n=1 Tax=Fulvivirga sp. TaxID=1931237 RepID=UPI0032EAD16B
MSRVYILLLLISLGCKPLSEVKYDADDYMHWFANSSLVKQKQTKYTNLEARLLPVEILAIRELGSDKLGAAGLDSVIKSYQDALYFELKISSTTNINLLKSETSNYEEYKERIHFLNFEAGDVFSLKVGDDSKDNLLYHFEGFSELSNTLNFLVAFEKPENLSSNDKITLSFEDPYWHSGINNFSFEIDEYINHPKLIIN